MNRKYNSIDGFRPVRRPSYSEKQKSPQSAPAQPKVATLKKPNQRLVQRRDGFVANTAARTAVNKLQVSQQDLRDEISRLEAEPTRKSRGKSNKYSRLGLWQKKPKTSKPEPSARRKLIKRIIIAIVIIIAGILIYYLVSIAGRAANVLDNVLNGDASGLLKVDPLKQDSEKRTNILIFGTESENINSQHGGPLLTDSIMVFSYNNETQKTAMISIPRDLWVRLEEACSVGYSAKINTVYQCASNDATDEKAGAEALSRKITDITGLDIHYYVHINFQAVISLVDAVGGVEVMIESDDPRGIYDPNFDWQCNHRCNMVKYPNGPTGLMDGQHALALIRARNAQGGYGLSRSNYDREDNQRKVLTALMKKLINDGTLLDVNKLMTIMESVGKNVRTNFGTNEVRSAVTAAKKLSEQMSNNTIKSISLVSVTKTGNISGQSVVIPASGQGDYSAIQDYIKKQLSAEAFIEEEPTVIVLNASDQSGLAQKVADFLEKKGMTVVQVTNAPENRTGAGYVYLRAGVEKPQTLAYLKDKIKLATDVDNQARYSGYGADFVVVLGDDFVFNQ